MAAVSQPAQARAVGAVRAVASEFSYAPGRRDNRLCGASSAMAEGIARRSRI